MRVMVVDDSRFMATIAERLLNKMGHEAVFKAHNGEEAIDYYAQSWFDIDLVLLDVVMPRMDGLQVLRHILNMNPDAKVIMLTAISNQRIVTGAMKLGAQEFITKPFRLSEFIRAVNKVLND